MLAMLSSSRSGLPLQSTTGTWRYFPHLFASCSVLVTVGVSGRPFAKGAANCEEQIYCDKRRSIRSAASAVPRGVCCFGFITMSAKVHGILPDISSRCNNIERLGNTQPWCILVLICNQSI